MIYDFVAMGRLSSAIKELAKEIVRAVSVIARFFENCLSSYPNKRIVYLALYHPKKRIRKKNINRIMKWIKKERIY